MNEKSKSRLGRGLDALFAEEEIYVPSTPLTEEMSDLASNQDAGTALMPVEFIRPGNFQPRSHFDENALNELAASIKQHGILQPLLVRPVVGEADQFELIAGERRWRAAQKAQLHEVPVIIQEFDDVTALEIGLIENLQREDLNPIEEASGYARLMDQFGYTQETLAEKVGKSRSAVANILRLLKLPADIQALVKAEKISTGHARALIGYSDPSLMADRIIKEGLSVRQLEQILSSTGESELENSPKTLQKSNKAKKSIEVQRLEQEMENMLGLKVTIESAGEKGVVSLHYKTLDQMDMILQKLSG